MRTVGVQVLLRRTLHNRCCGLVSLLNPPAAGLSVWRGRERLQQTIFSPHNRCCGLVSLLIQLQEEVTLSLSRPLQRRGELTRKSGGV